MAYYSNQHSRRGNATVYTIAALLIVGFIGTALLKMAHQDVIGGADYYQATRARLAAKAGIQKFLYLVENDPDSVISIVYKLAIDSLDSYWAVGDSITYEELNTTSSYRVEAVGIDPENFVIHLQSYGRTGNSRATIDATVELGNLELARSTSADRDFALYVGEVNSFFILDAVDIKGNTAISGSVNFDIGADGSIFRGTFRTIDDGTNSNQMWRGHYIFEQLAYFGNPVRGDGSMHMTFQDLSAFEESPSSNAKLDTCHFHADTWMNNNSTGGVHMFLNGHNLSHTTAFNYNPSEWHDVGTEMQSPDNPMDIADSVGLSMDICMPDLDTSVFTSAQRLSWAKLHDPFENSESPLSYDPNTGTWWEIDGTMCNKIWEYANSAGRLWRGFAVVDVDTTIDVIPGGTFDKKIIFIINKGRTFDPSVGGGMFRTSETANMVLYGEPGSAMQNIGHWGFARGYIYADSGATINMGGNAAKFDPFVGAIHVQDEADMNWYPEQNPLVSTVTYDAEVIEDLTPDGFLTFPCGGPSDPTVLDSIVFVEGFEIQPRVLGINY